MDDGAEEIEKVYEGYRNVLGSWVGIGVAFVARLCIIETWTKRMGRGAMMRRARCLIFI